MPPVFKFIIITDMNSSNSNQSFMLRNKELISFDLDSCWEKLQQFARGYKDLFLIN